MELTAEEKQLIEMFRKLDERGKKDSFSFVNIQLSLTNKYQDRLTVDQLEIVK